MTTDPKLNTVPTIGYLRTEIMDYHVTVQKFVEGDTPAQGLVYIGTPVCSLDNGGYREPIEMVVMCPSIFEYRPGEIEVRSK